MGKALEIIAGRVTAPGATITALTMATGNSNTIRNTMDNSKVHLLAAITKNQTAGIFRIKSPRLHDNVQNIRLGTNSGRAQTVFMGDFLQPLIPQDTLDLGLSGSATGGDIELAALLIYYENLIGINANLIDPSELVRRGVNIMTIENTIATGTSGDWTGQESIVAEYDLMKANTDYALVGYLCSALCGMVRWQGVDTGNLGVGGPGSAAADFTDSREFFQTLSYQSGLPCIPVFNSANKQAILIDAAQDENGTDVTVQSIFVELAPE